VGKKGGEGPQEMKLPKPGEGTGTGEKNLKGRRAWLRGAGPRRKIGGGNANEKSVCHSSIKTSNFHRTWGKEK